MYVREIDGEKLNFQVSGMLWKRSLVMRDLETGTLWSHLLGRGMRGQHQGLQLEILPAAMTNWQDWRARHPDTTLLAMSRTARAYTDRAWRDASSFVYGLPRGAIADSEAAPAVSLATLQRNQIVPLEAGDTALIVTHHPTGGSAHAYLARIEAGDTLSFERIDADTMRDIKTGSIWQVLTGKAIAGSHKGKRLTEIPGTISFRHAWEDFFPGEKIW